MTSLEVLEDNNVFDNSAETSSPMLVSLLRDRLEKSEKARERLRNTLQKLRERIIDTSALVNLYTKTDDSLRTLSAENEELRNQLERIRREATNHRVQWERQLQETENLRCQLDVLIQQSLPLQEALTTSQNEVEELKNQLERKEEHISSQKVYMTQLQAEIKELIKRKRFDDEAFREKKVLESQLHSLEEENNQLKSSIHSLKTDLYDSNEKIYRLQKDNEQLRLDLVRRGPLSSFPSSSTSTQPSYTLSLPTPAPISSSTYTELSLSSVSSAPTTTSPVAQRTSRKRTKPTSSSSAIPSSTTLRSIVATPLKTSSEGVKRTKRAKKTKSEASIPLLSNEEDAWDVVAENTMMGSTTEYSSDVELKKMLEDAFEEVEKESTGENEEGHETPSQSEEQITTTPTETTREKAKTKTSKTKTKLSSKSKAKTKRTKTSKTAKKRDERSEEEQETEYTSSTSSMVNTRNKEEEEGFPTTDEIEALFSEVALLSPLPSPPQSPLLQTLEDQTTSPSHLSLSPITTSPSAFTAPSTIDSLGPMPSVCSPSSLVVREDQLNYSSPAEGHLEHIRRVLELASSTEELPSLTSSSSPCLLSSVREIMGDPTKTQLVVQTAFEVLGSIATDLGDVFSYLSHSQQEDNDISSTPSSSSSSSSYFLTKKESFVVEVLSLFSSSDSVDNTVRRRTLLDELLERLFDFALEESQTPSRRQRSLHSCRQLVAISKKLRHRERVRVFLFDLIQEFVADEGSIDQLFIIATVWPESIRCGKEEEDILLKTMELVVSSQMFSSSSSSSSSPLLSERFKKLCELLDWKDSMVTDSTLESWVDELVLALVKIAGESTEQERTKGEEIAGKGEEGRTRTEMALLSSDTFTVIKSFELIARRKGHLWTNNFLIVGKLWKLLEPTTPNPIMIAIIRSIGIVGKTMLPSSHWSQSPAPSLDVTVFNAVSQLQKRLNVVLAVERRNVFSFGAQIAAAQSLIDLARGSVRTSEVGSVLNWYRGLSDSQLLELPKSLLVDIERII